MALTLEELKKIHKKKEPQQFESNYYPFWNMKDGEQAVIRFVPDKNEDCNLGFMVVKQYHNLVINGEDKSVPCLSMYGDNCPICKVSGAFYKKDDRVNGKQYWKKKQHLAQALIVEDPLAKDGKSAVGELKMITINFQLYQVIQAALEDGDLEAIPYDLENGYDFVIKKTKQGQYSSYSFGSKFKSKPRALTPAENQVVREKSIDLATLLPKKPEDGFVDAMLKVSLDSYEYGDATKTTKSEAAKMEMENLDMQNNPLVEVDEAATEQQKILEQVKLRRSKKEV